MADWTEDPLEAKNRDEKRRQQAEKVLRKFFKDRKGTPIPRKTAYLQKVSSFPDKDKVVPWAFHEWIDKEIREGRMKSEPIYEVVGHNLIYTGDD